MVDCDNLVSAQRRKSDFDKLTVSASRMENGTPTAFAMRVDQCSDRDVDPGLRKRGDDECALPFAIAFGRPMLDRATSAGSKIPADRRDALNALVIDAQQTRP